MASEAELDAVPWSRLRHAYGSAKDVPEHLRQLRSEDEQVRAQALSALRQSINHQGSVYSASAAALPFLVTMARDESVPQRHRLLALVVDLATGDHRNYLERGYDVQAPTRGSGAEASTTRAAQRAYRHFVELLADDSACVRAAAALALAFVPPARRGPCSAAATGVAAALVGRLSLESITAVRASVLLALGLAGCRQWLSVEPARLIGALSAGVATLDRVAAAIACCVLMGAEPSAPHASQLVDSLRDGLRDGLRLPAASPDDLPFNAGDMAGYAARIMRGQTSARSDAATIAALLSAVESAQLMADERNDAAGKAAARVIDVAFAAFDGRRDDEVVPVELNAAQLKALEVLAHKGLAAPYARFGLPHVPADLLRMCGAALPGPLDEPLLLRAERGAPWPLWKWLRRVARGLDEAQPLLRHLQQSHEPAALLAICRDVVAGAYTMVNQRSMLRDDQAAILVELIAPVAAATLPLLVDWVRELLAVELEGDIAPLAAATVIVPLMRYDPGAALPLVQPRNDLLVARVMRTSESLGREVLSMLPESRREALILRFPVGWSWRYRYLDLCVSVAVARRLLQLMNGAEDELDMARARELLTVFESLLVVPIQEALQQGHYHAPLLLRELARLDVSAALPALIAALSQRRRAVRTTALELLASMDKDELAAALAAALSGGRTTRSRAARALLALPASAQLSKLAEQAAAREPVASIRQQLHASALRSAAG